MELRKYFAEFLGTAILVTMAVGAAVFGGIFSPIVGALAFGLVLIAIIFMFGAISGGHFNPAVSLAQLMGKKISVRDFVGYVISQVAGAIVGAFFIFLIWQLLGFNAEAIRGMMGINTYEHFQDGFDFGLGIGGLGGATMAGAVFAAFLIEVVLTFVFVFTILAVTRKTENRYVAPIVIGLALTLVHLVGIPLTGTSVNPARSIGPALFGGWELFRQQWLFILAPLAGGALAAITAKFMFKGEEEKETPATAKSE
ncbi:MAG: aquaporin [Firmicutes bacterium]|nr:aquaporin [Bacillota bacterium]